MADQAWWQRRQVPIRGVAGLTVAKVEERFGGLVLTFADGRCAAIEAGFDPGADEYTGDIADMTMYPFDLLRVGALTADEYARAVNDQLAAERAGRDAAAAAEADRERAELARLKGKYEGGAA